MKNDNLSCEGSCETHRGEVITVIIEGHGWDGMTFNYCQEAIEEDKRRGFVLRSVDELSSDEPDLG